MKPVKVVVNDLMQSDYCYFRTEPPGENFDPEFKPELSPAKMLRMGVFGGKYMTDCVDEFPAEWFENAKLSPERKNKKLNFFEVDASKPLSYWREKGWIWEDDPRGWFQWYCRYWMGRRCEDDARQVDPVDQLFQLVETALVSFGKAAQIHENDVALISQALHGHAPGILVAEKFRDAISPVRVRLAVHCIDALFQVLLIFHETSRQTSTDEFQEFMRFDSTGDQVRTRDHADTARIAPQP